MGAMISRFVKVDDRYINMGAVKYAEVLYGGDVMIFTGTQSDTGEDIASITLSGEDARWFIAFLDKHSDHLIEEAE